MNMYLLNLISKWVGIITISTMSIFGLYSEENIKVHVAVLGEDIKIKTILEDVKLKIPKGTQSGTIFRIKVKGCPVLNEEDKRGDHYVRINVEIPTKLNKKEKDLWEEISKV